MIKHILYLNLVIFSLTISVINATIQSNLWGKFKMKNIEKIVCDKEKIISDNEKLKDMSTDEYCRYLIKNDSFDDSDEFDKECTDMLNEIKKLDGFDVFNLLCSFKNIGFFHCDIDITNFKEDTIKIAFLNLLQNLHIYTRNEKVLKYLVESYLVRPADILELLLESMKSSVLYYNDKYNNDDFTRMEFPIQNIPIIRIMKFCLENDLFEIYSLCAEKLEPIFIEMFFDTHLEQINKKLEDSKNNSNILYLFFNLSDGYMKKVSIMKYTSLLENSSYYALFNLIKHAPQNFIMSDSFIEGFKKCKCNEQIDIIARLEEYEYPISFIKKLHNNLNKESIKQILTQDFIENKYKCYLGGEAKSRLDKIYNIIFNSSYFKKNNIGNTDFWNLITTIKNNNWKQIVLNERNLYEELMNLYKICYNYATESIVNSLYPLDTLKDKITYLENIKFNVLVRVMTMFDCATLEESFEKRTFAGFSIINEKNFSHYGNTTLYGYYSGLSHL